MPIYEYDCAACGGAFELLIRSKRDERVARCPTCESDEVARRLSVFATHGGRSAAPPRARCGGCAMSEDGCPFQQRSSQSR